MYHRPNDEIIVCFPQRHEELGVVEDRAVEVGSRLVIADFGVIAKMIKLPHGLDQKR